MSKKGFEIGLILLLIVLSWIFLIIEFSVFPIVVFLIAFLILILSIPIKETKEIEETPKKEPKPKKEPIPKPEVIDKDVPTINFPEKFDEHKFLDGAFELYKDIQTDFMNFEYDGLMNKLGFEMYEQFSKQMKSLQAKDKQSVRTNFVLDKIETTSFTQDSDSYLATVNLVISEDKYMKDINDDFRITSAGVRYESGYCITIAKRHKKKTVKKCSSCHEKLIGNPFKCPKCVAMLMENNENWIMIDLKLLGSHSKKES